MVFYGPLFPEGATLREPMGPFVVPDDYYFTLGDNRDNSKDSRYWGFVPHANIPDLYPHFWVLWFCWYSREEKTNRTNTFTKE